MDVIGVCTTGAQAMHYADTVDDGIVVCGYRMKDMMYTQLREYLPESFEMLLVASQDKWSSGERTEKQRSEAAGDDQKGKRTSDDT